MRGSDFKVPLRQWSELGEYDRQRYHELRLFFKQQQKDFVRECRPAPFSAELMAILSYIDHQRAGRDQRCIVCGIACGGPLVCVNAQQLKHLVGRCKSSINNGFQQIGYEVMRDRIVGRDAILAMIPELHADPPAIRQWTVRYATESCQLCFCSVLTPPALAIHAREAARPQVRPKAQRVPIELPKPTFDIGIEGNDGEMGFPDFGMSWSVDTLSELDGPDRDGDGFCEEKKIGENQAMPRSQSGIMAFRFS
jgi:hypothetical protein